MQRAAARRCGRIALAVFLVIPLGQAQAQQALDQPPPPPAPEVSVETICMVVGQVAQVDAIVTPPDPKIAARLYFTSNLSPERYFVKMAPVGTPEPGAASRVRALLPRPSIQASPVTYRVEAVSAGGTIRSSEIIVKIVRRKEDCPVGLSTTLAPDGDMTVFDAAGATASKGVLGEGRRSFVATAAELVGGAVLAGGAFAYFTKDWRRDEPGSPGDPYGPASPCR